KIGHSELRSIVLIARLDVDGAYGLGHQIGVPLQPWVIQERVIQAGCAEGAAIQSLQSDMRRRVPYNAASRNNVQRNIADLIGLKSTNQFQIVGEFVLVLRVKAALFPASLSVNEGLIQLRAVDMLEERAK